MNSFYTELGKEGVRKGHKSATAKIDLVAFRKEKGMTCVKIAEIAGIDAHIIREADQRNADILADVFLKKA